MRPSKPRVLFWDIETAGVNALKSDLGFVVCFGYKWLGDKKANCITARRQDLKVFSDKWLLKKGSKLLREADITVAHFGSVFDRRFFQGRLLINGMKPIPNTRMRDTCIVSRSVANFSSNRLGHLSKILKLKQKKMEKGRGWPDWWMRAMQGDMSALASMKKYCVQDVETLEQLYLRLRPFDNPHPRVYETRMDKSGRPLCGSCGKVGQFRGHHWHAGNKYRRYQCLHCGHWGRAGLV